MDVDIQGFIKKKRLVSKFYNASVGAFFIINILVTPILVFDHIQSKNKIYEDVYMMEENGNFYLKNGFGKDVKESEHFFLKNTYGGLTEVENVERFKIGYSPIKTQELNDLVKKRVSSESLMLIGLLWLFFLAYLFVPTALKNLYRFIMKE